MLRRILSLLMGCRMGRGLQTRRRRTELCSVSDLRLAALLQAATALSPHFGNSESSLRAMEDLLLAGQDRRQGGHR